MNHQMSRFSAHGAKFAARGAGGDRERISSDQGQAVVFVALVYLPLVILMAVMVIDVGATLALRRNYQSTADLAALAAVVELPNQTEATARGLEWIERNAFDASGTVNITFPTANQVQVSLTSEYSSTFARVIGLSSWDVSATAIAELGRSPLPSSLMTMNESGCASLSVEGSAQIIITGGGETYTRSDCPSHALYVGGMGQLVAGSNEVVGGWSGSGISPQPAPAPWRPDPYGDLDLDAQRPTTCYPASYEITGVQTLSPDHRYCAPLRIGGQAVVTVPSGFYWLEQGIVVEGQATLLMESPNGEVLFYSTCPISPCNGTGLINATPTIRFAGGAQASLRGHPGFGNVLFWVDRTAASGCLIEFEGSAAAGFSGSTYAVPCHVRIAGNADMTLHMSFVTGSLSASGEAKFTIPFESSTAPSEPYPALIQ